MEKIILSKGYMPSEREEYMNPMHLEYFKQKLQNWKKELIQGSQDTIKYLQEENWNKPDINDRASLEAETEVELKTRNRYRKLISKIDIALEKIEDKEYGYCEETGEPIGLKRLMARPIASLCIEAQERHERHESQHIDKDDETEYLINE